MSTPPVAALVFDLGGVIVSHDNPVMHRRLASRAGADPAAIAAIIADAGWDTGRPMAELYATLTRELGYDASWEIFVDDWCCHLALDPSMLAYVEALASRRRVMIFSNTNEVHWDHLTALSNGHLGAFERYLSHELGLRKPHAAAFAKVAEAAGARPETLLFFDDVQANVDGARAAGLQAERFEGEEGLRALLEGRGLST